MVLIWPVSVIFKSPLAMSQNLIVLSLLPDTNHYKLESFYLVAGVDSQSPNPALVSADHAHQFPLGVEIRLY